MNCSDLLLTIVYEPDEEFMFNAIKPEAAFVMFAVPAVALSLKKSVWMLLVI